VSDEQANRIKRSIWRYGTYKPMKMFDETAYRGSKRISLAPTITSAVPEGRLKSLSVPEIFVVETEANNLSRDPFNLNSENLKSSSSLMY
jgi:hypothetical protein